VHQTSDGVDRETDQSSHQRAVDAHKLQVSSYRQLESLRRRRGVPARDGLRDQVADFDAVLLNDARGQIDQQIVDLRENGGIRL